MKSLSQFRIETNYFKYFETIMPYFKTEEGTYFALIWLSKGMYIDMNIKIFAKTRIHQYAMAFCEQTP